MFARHVWIRFGGKVGVEQMRCSGNYFELCHTRTHTRRDTGFSLTLKFVIHLYSLVLICI